MFKKNEKGRSMVEMLGVLAIIGVLSISGIAGYSLAMARHRANEAAHHVSMVYIQLQAAAAQGKQGEIVPEVPDGSIVKLGSTGSYTNAGIVVDFKNDKAACKQFFTMYEGRSDFYVKNGCES